jgi:hypothetical protein
MGNTIDWEYELLEGQQCGLHADFGDSGFTASCLASFRPSLVSVPSMPPSTSVRLSACPPGTVCLPACLPASINLFFRVYQKASDSPSTWPSVCLTSPGLSVHPLSACQVGTAQKPGACIWSCGRCDLAKRGGIRKLAAAPNMQAADSLVKAAGNRKM